MSSAPLRQRVLSLYRRALRTGRSWEGPPEEKTYIREEAQRQWRAHQKLDLSPAEVESKLIEGEQRLEYALHYKIPYPRLQHASQWRNWKLPTPQIEDPAGSRLASSDPGVSEKLAAALKRRQEKLAKKE